MNVKWIVAPVFGMVVLVAWGMVFWGFLAAPFGVFHKLPDDRAVTAELQKRGTATGTYFMPWPRATSEEFSAFEAQHKAGPFYRLSFVKEGVNPSSPSKLLIGTLHYFTVAVLATALVWLARTRSFGRAWAIVFLGGLLGSNLITIGDPVWFHLPWDYAKGVLFYEMVAWFLLGLAVAAVCPKYTGPHSQAKTAG